MENQLWVSSSPHIRSEVTTQRVMRDVAIALTPAALWGVYSFGMPALIIMVISILTCVISEIICQKIRKTDVTVDDFSAVVTGLLLGMNLPASVPYWIPFVGGVFAIVIVKQIFGGLGHNFMNPALAARAMLVASWPVEMTTFHSPAAFDTLTSATPLSMLKGGDLSNLPSLFDVFVGKIGGSIGETSALLLILGGLYLVYRGVIAFRIPCVFIGTFGVLAFIATGFDFHMTMMHILTGGMMIGAIFMATDYVSSPITKSGQVIYAVGIAVITFVIRFYGGLPEGVSYAILFMNVVSPLINRYTRPKVFGGVKS